MSRHLGSERVWPGDDRQHPGREDALGDLAIAQRCQRREGRRLHHNGIAGDQRRDDLPERQQHREVPRRDRPNHAQRHVMQLDDMLVGLLDDLDRNAAGGDLPDPANRLIDLRRRHRRGRLALLQNQQTDERVEPCLQSIGEAVQIRLAFVDMQRRPAANACLGAGERLIHLLRRRRGCLGEHLAGRRIDDVDAVLRIDQPAGDTEPIRRREERVVIAGGGHDGLPGRRSGHRRHHAHATTSTASISAAAVSGDDSGFCPVISSPSRITYDPQSGPFE
jgi:hypothetical protein